MRTDVRFPARTSLEQILDGFTTDPGFAAMVTRWERLPAIAPRYAPFPVWLDERIVRTLRARGIDALYSHQARALESAHARAHTVVVTPTASGKTLCYDLPVLHEIAKDPSARALFIFPTKALAQDQLAELERLSGEMEIELKTHTYDGDTPPQARAAIRAAGHVVITNPDMLHTGILPHHTKWVKLFENLRYVVLDELHTYRGVFGSNVANVLRRLRRICAFYGSHPTFICTSATIANPEELARRHVEDDVVLIDDSGAPRGEKVLAFIQPQVVNPSLGIRRSALLTGRDIAATLLASGIQTICFTRTRVQTELLLTYLRSRFPEPQWPADLIRGYRGGYLPSERRAIERGLRDGSVRGVVSTNALELGIDIGALQAAVLVGYPGTVASTLQQMGRAGRRGELSVAFLVATSSPTDQYVIEHPDFVLGRPPEQGLVNPDNLHVLVGHLKCAAFELPFDRSERFGTEDTPGVLSYLDEQGILHEAQGRYHWSAQAFPAEAMSLRTASNDNVVIVDDSHLDLLHPARRLWKDRFGSTTLRQLEASILDEPRHNDDIPGALIPDRYFAYLRSGDERLIAPILRHNARDVISLVKIADHVARAVTAARCGRVPDHAPAALALARIFERHGESEVAAWCYESAYVEGDATIRARSALPYARVLERRGDAERAITMLETLLGLGCGTRTWRQQAESRVRRLMACSSKTLRRQRGRSVRA